MNLITLGIVGIVVMIIMILLGVNIGLTMAIVGFVGYALTNNWNAAVSMIGGIPFTQGSNYTMAVIPLFVLMGEFSLYSGLSSGLFTAADRWLCQLRGGLAIATVMACAFFAAICGSTAATAVTMATIALPEMRKADYDDSLSTGCLAAGGTLGILIPPSTVFVIYGITAEQSVGALFAAGIIPGILLALSYAVTISIECRVRPELAPQVKQKFTLKEKTQSLVGVLPTVILFIAIIGGMFAGLFSSTEAAAMGAVICLIFMILKREFTFKRLLACIVSTAKTTGMVFIIMFGATSLGYFLTVTGLPAALARFIEGLSINRYIIMFILVLIYLVLGCIMDSLAMILITVPILLPVVTGLGFSPIWYGVIMVMVAELGQMTPPVGLNLFIIGGTAKDVPMAKIIKGTFPFVISCLITTLIVLFVEPLSLWLPSLIYG